MTDPDPRNIMGRLMTALKSPEHQPVRIWLDPLDYAALCAVAYRETKGATTVIHKVEDLPVAKDQFGQSSRIVAHNGKVMLV